uniref:Uncharacterized protein n=1 Tax=Ananas comosus var. bracteatus TaxID=296719 RepID=A0A6V7NT20_ANACO|nr:unnamed protein product [Ananas comosus var. bracteatus]
MYAAQTEEAAAAENVVAGIILLYGIRARALFDTGASHSFIDRLFAELHGIPFASLLHPGRVVVPDHFLTFGSFAPVALFGWRWIMPVDLLALHKLGEFDIVLGMDWLTKYFATIDVLWSNHDEREATWELESALRERHPHLSDGCLRYFAYFEFRGRNSLLGGVNVTHWTFANCEVRVFELCAEQFQIFWWPSHENPKTDFWVALVAFTGLCTANPRLGLGVFVGGVPVRGARVPVRSADSEQFELQGVFRNCAGGEGPEPPWKLSAAEEVLELLHPRFLSARRISLLLSRCCLLRHQVGEGRKLAPQLTDLAGSGGSGGLTSSRCAALSAPAD